MKTAYVFCIIFFFVTTALPSYIFFGVQGIAYSSIVTFLVFLKGNWKLLF
jgi:hypothetical protein